MPNSLCSLLRNHTGGCHHPKNALCSIYSALFFFPQILGSCWPFYCLYNFAFSSTECICLVLTYSGPARKVTSCKWGSNQVCVVQNFTQNCWHFGHSRPWCGRGVWVTGAPDSALRVTMIPPTAMTSQLLYDVFYVLCPNIYVLIYSKSLLFCFLLYHK